MRRMTLILIIILAAIACLQCSKPNNPEPLPGSMPLRTPADLTAAEKKVIASSNLFGFKLFREIASRENPDSNIFISPLSASFALGMVYNGAALETRDEMASALAYGVLSDQEINESYKGLMEILTHIDPTVIFEIANSIWYREGKPVRQSYADLCRMYFNSLVREVDFLQPGMADTINNWVSTQTHGHIDTVITPPISADLAMLLMNAIYFKGAWTHLFDTADTDTRLFYLPDGSGVDCRMMFREDTIRYFATDLFQAVDLPYGDKAFSMTVFLPVWGKTVDDIINQLNADNWSLWLAGFSDQEMTLGLPKFKFEYQVGLNDVLQAMGMQRAFLPSAAQFYNMFSDSIGWIDSVKQKTFVQVDENGTEAAAVTIVTIYDSAFAAMIADRPFLFVIHERESETILFMGRIVNPVWVE